MSELEPCCQICFSHLLENRHRNIFKGNKHTFTFFQVIFIYRSTASVCVLLLFNTCTACSVGRCHSCSSGFPCRIQHLRWGWAPQWAYCSQRRHTCIKKWKLLLFKYYLKGRFTQRKHFFSLTSSHADTVALCTEVFIYLSQRFLPLQC